MSKTLDLKVVDGEAKIRLKFNLGKEECRELVNILRRNFYYQKPLEVAPPDREKGEGPDFVVLRMLPGHWVRLMELIHKAGGWTMPPEEQRKRAQFVGPPEQDDTPNAS